MGLRTEGQAIAHISPVIGSQTRGESRADGNRHRRKLDLWPQDPPDTSANYGATSTNCGAQQLVQLTARVGWQKAVVALAKKNARILWSVLSKGKVFDPNYVSIKPGAEA